MLSFCRLRTRLRSPSCVAVKICCRSRRTSSSTRRQSTASQSMISSSGPFTITVSNLPIGCGVANQLLLTGSPDPRQLPFGPGSTPVSDQLCGSHSAEEPNRAVAGFLSPFDRRRWLLGSSCARWGVAPSSRSAYRRKRSPDPNGVVMLRMNKIRPGRVPPLPRGRWCAPGRRLSSGRHLPLSSGQSLRPRCHIPSAGVTFTRRHRGFTHVRPSPRDDRLPPRSREARPLPAGLLLARSPRMEREPLRLSTPGFAPRGHPQSTPRRRQALAHRPGYYTYGIRPMASAEPPNGASHFTHAPSCRTHP